MIKIAPSILAADPLNLERDVRRAEQAGSDWLHIDVMDAHFVPNLAYTPEIVRHLRSVVGLPLDVHLMMEHPGTMLDVFLADGADLVTLHAEIGDDLDPLLDRIHQAGARAGIALKPSSGLELLQKWLPKAEMVLTMTVEPGFGGQKLDERVIDKIRALRQSGYSGLIEADGGIRGDNLQRLIDAGLDVAVMGTALFNAPDMADAISRMHAMRPAEGSAGCLRGAEGTGNRA